MNIINLETNPPPPVPRYEVKNYRPFDSPDGGGFNAALYRNGKKVADLHDGGYGGQVEIMWTPREATVAEEAHWRAYLNSLPDNPELPSGFKWEAAIGDLVSAAETAKENANLLRRMKSRVMFIAPGLAGTRVLPAKYPPGPKVYAAVLAKHPGAVILNTAEPADAIALIRGAEERDERVNTLAWQAWEIMGATQDDSFAPTNAVRALPEYEKMTPAEREAVNARLVEIIKGGK